MAVNPLISLQVQGPDIEDPLVQRGKAVALINAQQQQQINAERLKSEQLANQETELKRKDDAIASKTFLEAGGDPTKHVQLMAQGGARPQSVQATQQHYAEYTKKLADTDKSTLENQAKRNELLLPLHDAALAAAQNGTLAQQWAQIYQQAAAIDPETAKHFSPDQPPTVEQIQASKNVHAMQDYLVKQAEEGRKQAGEQRAAAKAAPELAKATADATISQQTAAGQKPIQPEEQARMDLQKRSEERIARHDAASEKNATALLKVAQGRLGLEAQHAQIAKDIYDQTYGSGANPALQGVEPKLRTQAASAAQKAANEFTQASESTANMKSIIDLARSGNKVAYAYAPTTGVLTINTANGVKRVNMAEIKSYGGAGSALDQVEGWLGKKISGASIPADILTAMEQVNKTIADNAGSSYNSKLASINQNYRANFQPVKGTEAKSATTIYARDPQGQLHEAPAGTPLPAGWKEEKR